MYTLSYSATPKIHYQTNLNPELDHLSPLLFGSFIKLFECESPMENTVKFFFSLVPQNFLSSKQNVLSKIYLKKIDLVTYFIF